MTEILLTGTLSLNSIKTPPASVTLISVSEDRHIMQCHQMCNMMNCISSHGRSRCIVVDKPLNL